MHTKHFAFASSVAVSSLLAAPAAASILASADFSTYADGALVGQNGWLQYNTPTTAPLTVSAGRVSWVGNGAPTTSVNNQDAMLAFVNQIVQPESGETVLNFDLMLSISSAGTNPSYFAALNTLTTTSTTGNFQNVRLLAKANGTGFSFGTRVNGQSGYAASYGTQVLDFGQTYALRAEIHLVAGNANDFINVYVGNDFDSLSLHAVAGYGSGSVSDIAVGAMLLSQFASSSNFESGISVSKMSVSVVPAPGSIALIGLAGLTGFATRRRR